MKSCNFFKLHSFTDFFLEDFDFTTVFNIVEHLFFKSPILKSPSSWFSLCSLDKEYLLWNHVMVFSPINTLGIYNFLDCRMDIYWRVALNIEGHLFRKSQLHVSRSSMLAEWKKFFFIENVICILFRNGIPRTEIILYVSCIQMDFLFISSNFF